MNCIIDRKECPMRHKENGNCLPNGGFCFAVNDERCEALHNAYRKGWFNCYKEFVEYIERIEKHKTPEV